MSKPFIIFGVGTLIAGFIFLDNRKVPDQNVFANSGNASGASDQAGSAVTSDTAATPTPTATPSQAPTATPRPKAGRGKPQRTARPSERVNDDDGHAHFYLDGTR